MPDWFYRTLGQSLLFQFPPQRSRKIALHTLGFLSRLPLGVGSFCIQLLGHMTPPKTLRSCCGPTSIQSPLGLGWLVDPHGTATLAWQEFGFGFIEIGPFSHQGQHEAGLRQFNQERQIQYSNPPVSAPATSLSTRLSRLPRILKVPLSIRWHIQPDESPQEAAHNLLSSFPPILGDSRILAFHIDRYSGPSRPSWTTADWMCFWNSLPVLPGSTATPHPNLYWVIPSTQLRAGLLPTDLAQVRSCHGIIIEHRMENPDTVRWGFNEDMMTAVEIQDLRVQLPARMPLLISGGIHVPATAQTACQAGAQGLIVDTGMIFSGPGLPKRCNECLLASMPRPSPQEQHLHPSPVKTSWFWTLMLGVGMGAGSLVALWMALNRVVMPYDEAFCGLTRDQIQQLNPRLLPFMAHDRVTLAGTMLSIAVIYATFSWYGIRQGIHACRTSVLISAGTGFFSFFLFLGFDYFDPFHAFITAILFQLFVQALVQPFPMRDQPDGCDPGETTEWRRALWGQLLLVIHAIGLLLAGLTITYISLQHVLVATDQEYLRATPDQLYLLHRRLMPLIAHDRATLGGMLLAVGIPYLLSALWLLQRNRRWLWHAQWVAGLCAYVPALGIHFAVGYVHWIHLAPAIAGMLLLLTGSWLTHSWMTKQASTA